MKRALLALSIAGSFTVSSAHASAQPRPRWVGPLAIDRDASRVLRARDEDVRRAADRVSWAIVGGLMAAPLAVDARAAVERNASPLVVGEGLLSLAIPYASTALVGFAAKYLFARERPFATREGLAARCLRGDEPGCEWDRNGSFPSMHSALGFAAAGALCVHAMRATGTPALDVLTCASGTFSATIAASLRMVADRHYVTDVLVGSLLGLTLSSALTWALHMQPSAPLALATSIYRPTVDPLPSILGGALGVASGALTLAALSGQWR